MKKRLKIIAAALSVTVVICGCTVQDETDRKKEETKRPQVVEAKQEETEGKEYQGKLDMIEPAAYRSVTGLDLEPGSYISIIGKGKDGQFWKEVKKGVEQAAVDINEELGYTGKDQVKVTYSGPSEDNNVDEQVNILDEELARYPVAVSISIVDTQACSVQFDLAGEGGIPVVAFDSGSDYPGLSATVSTNNVESARAAADRLAELMGDTGEVIVLVQDSKSQSAAERENGFAEVLAAEHPNMTIAETYHMDQLEEMQNLIAGDTGEAAEDITQDDVLDYLLEKHPEIRGCYATNGDTVKLALRALERQSISNLFIVGYDGDEEEIKALQDGKLDGLIVQNPFGMGYASVIAAARASLSMGNEAFVDTGYTWVTKENLESTEVQKMLY